MMTHSQLLTKWLRGKNYHANDILAAVEWYEQQVAAGAQPTDINVRAMADKFHEQFLNTSKSIVDAKVEERFEKLVNHIDTDLRKHRPIVYGFYSGMAGALVFEGIKWLLTALM